MIKKSAVLLLAFALFPLASQAVTISFSDSIASQSTNWNQTLSVSQFDPSLGTLNSVTIDFIGTVEGGANAESLNASAALVTLTLSADIEFSGASNASLSPASANNQNLSGFDGSIDFGGTSGVALAGLSDTKNSQEVLGAAPAFIGVGTVQFDVDGTGASSASGVGNLITQFTTSAGAGVTVTYDYTVPEPGVVALLPFAALIGLRRRR